ncbi:unnamed protein product [Pieris brassicae]|uniref:Reverse transcriptase domain-containing protein n=1 Tax=Pieris brassicae TaxID=7116 RepID=A0A9P0XI41_PIEBR|nr:unnamed protein product [Pieris brassicae]
MPKWRPPKGRRAVYWWTSEIGNLRGACSEARRAYYRSQRRRRDGPDVTEGLRSIYNDRKRAHRGAICEAKERAHQEVLRGLDDDPWGRPYRSARKRLKGAGMPLVESLEPAFLDRVVADLFPLPPDIVPPCMAATVVEAAGEMAPEVSDIEMEAILTRLKARKKAPGPDGVHARVLAVVLPHMEVSVRELYTACLRSGRFPVAWKTGRLCLVRKEGRSADSSAAYRPIVLLDEAGKALEWVVASRLCRHLSAEGPDLSEAQYGFRAGRSTLDALWDLRSHTSGVVDGGGRALATYDVSIKGKILTEDKDGDNNVCARARSLHPRRRAETSALS